MSKLQRKLADPFNIGQIKGVRFGLINHEKLRKSSVCEITVAEQYDSGNEPKSNGLFDPRMGILERGRLCPTDELDVSISPGYFGHIELALPVYWHKHVDTVVKILRCVCIRCSNILLDKSNPQIIREIKKKTAQGRFKDVVETISKATNKKCLNENCGFYQPNTYRKVTGDKLKNSDTVIQIEAEYKGSILKESQYDKNKMVMEPQVVFNILKRISKEDAELLGFIGEDCRPEYLMCKVLPVAPPCVRPSVRPDNNQRHEDDITFKYSDIVKQNNNLKEALAEKKEDRTKAISIYHGFLQLHIVQLVDNDIDPNLQSGHRSGRPLKLLSQRIKSKEGRIRTNLMGKRVDFSARTVIDVDPNLSIEQFGVPLEIAMNLTFPEVVNKYNIHKLTELVRNGPNIHPGAKQIIKMNYDEIGKPNPETISLKYIDRTTVILQEGDIVERHLIDGDIGFFNRQPTLHRPSMMGHRISNERSYI